MHHLAIMRKSWGLIPKILSGKKTIESRWYQNRYAPWNKIQADDAVYFKNTSEPATARAEVSEVLQFDNLTPGKVKKILNQYGTEDGLGIEELDKYYQMFKNKKYCILVFLKSPRPIKPFEINKTGFGAMTAWIRVGNVDRIKI